MERKYTNGSDTFPFPPIPPHTQYSPPPAGMLPDFSEEVYPFQNIGMRVPTFPPGVRMKQISPTEFLAANCTKYIAVDVIIVIILILMNIITN